MSVIIGVCGYHGSGKTTLIEKLIKELTKDGYKVATIKNIPKAFSIDMKGKDTWRHGEAGAKVIVVSSPNETSFIFKGGLEPEEIAKILDFIIKPDVILIEGRKEAKIQKIAVGDIEIDDATLRYDENFDEILGYIIDSIEIDRIYDELPKLDCGKCGNENCMEMAKAIHRGEKSIEDCIIPKNGVKLRVNGEDIPIGPFVLDIIKNTILGMISSLKGVEKIDELEIEIRS
jgi:molybdopterin-guanine dinucleotide biosynthesis protein B